MAKVIFTTRLAGEGPYVAKVSRRAEEEGGGVVPVSARIEAELAAGVIHTDFERGFIRAEVYSVADLEKYQSELAIKQAGKLRIEGKQ